MTAYKNWVSKQQGKPVWLVSAAFGAILCVYIGVSKIWIPYRQRMKRSVAADYGSFLYEQERKR